MTEQERYSTGNKCFKCGSEEIIPDVGMGYDVKVILGGSLFRSPVSTAARANVCGICGFMELYAEQPETLRKAYFKIKAKAKMK